MPDTAQQRQTSPPYSALNAPGNGDASRTAAARGPVAPPVPLELDALAAETDRLESLKQALFAAFLAAPKTGIPTALVDLAATYTSALRLQLTLKGLGNVHTRGGSKTQGFTTGRR